jgi:Cu/Ag efflux pump CusA
MSRTWRRVRYVENTRDASSRIGPRADGAVTGGPAVTLAIAKRAGANAVVVAEDVLHRVQALEPKLIPEGVTVTVTRDYGETANEKANELLFHLGLATVSIIAWSGWPSAGARRWWWPSSFR